jgi:hypothetical protein
LLITITLLAFLVLLLVSLAALTRVETSVAANNQQLAQARQNALLAMNVAIGQLQKYAGADARITARAEVTSTSAVTNPNLTGVWDAAGAGTAASAWLVSGSETASSPAVLLASIPDPSDDTLTTDTLFLVGDQSIAVNPSAPTAAEKARRIKVTKQNIVAPAGSVPGLGAAATPQIGRYAWWVGDQGVKASLALPDRASEVTYAPWNTPVQRQRMRQQIASMPNYFRASNATTAYAKEGFDPLTTSGVLKNVQTDGQLGMVTPVAGSMPEFVRGRFHDFTTASRAVLANTRSDAHAGLMRDLSLKPDELGNAFKAYADYASYMETPGQTVSGAAVAYPEILNADSPRRRYQVVAPVSSLSSDAIPDLVFGVTPVVTEVLVQFSVEFASGYKVGTKVYVGLWNPYTSALVPPGDLYVTVTGFPRVTIFNHSGTGSASLDLQASLPAEIKDTSSGAMRLYLPFTEGTQADTKSWLPGRIYGWTTKSNLDGAIDDRLKFYNKTITSIQRWYYGVGPLPGGSSGIGVTAPPVSALTIELRNPQGLLATYTTPAFSGFTIPADPAPSTKWFAYACRLKQASNTDKDRSWLKTFDPRSSALPATAWGTFDPNVDASSAALNPALFSGSSANTAQSGFLIYRIQGTSAAARSSYNDVPLFELPRLPLLSVGELQHLQSGGRRPFSVGNSWGAERNVAFDRFFFSGLPAATTAVAGVPNLAAGQPLPNWNLRVVNDASAATIQAAGALSSRHLLQAGGFNINSTSVAAWRAILSGVRVGTNFLATDIENSSGLALGTQKTSTSTVPELFNADDTLGVGVIAPVFSRFPQSAQETFSWKQPTPATSDERLFDSYAFRLGVRGNNNSTAASSTVANTVTAQRLTTDQIEALAIEIVRLIKEYSVASGPFRSLEEFLAPASGAPAGTPSLLEAAIATAGLNQPSVQPLDTVASFNDFGFSSLTLTQADILTALAPYLRARSDTFTVRGYGEALNPVTNEVAGKAWLEATVQRFPEVVDPADDIAKPTGPFGRRFKIISFRWLSPSDI